MDTNVDNCLLPIPSSLIEAVRAMAAEEQRPAADVVRDILEKGLKDRRWQRTLAYGQERARALGLTEEDIPRLIAETRRERRSEQTGA